ncbi:MAG: hypothetical protein QOF30_2674 [Acidimicrobiaceae bacterium]|jgi:hypothetical protein|nr:hypothetical protein [Acidimicrobiaceae bacterium]
MSGQCGQSSPVPDDDQDEADGTARSGGAGRANRCRGCGQGPEDLDPRHAIAVTAVVERRLASLLAHPEHTLRNRGPGRGSWSALEPALRVAHVLAAADRGLRHLFGDDALQPIAAATETPRSVPSRPTVSQVRAALADNARRLTATIAGATTQDWRRRQPHHGATPGELVWSAVHDATHHLEDAELLLDATTAPERHQATQLPSIPFPHPDHSGPTDPTVPTSHR